MGNGNYASAMASENVSCLKRSEHRPTSACTGPSPASFARALYHYVAHLLADGVHVMLAVPGPPGEYPSVAILNEELRDAASRNDHAPIEAIFAEALALNEVPSPRFKHVSRA